MDITGPFYNQKEAAKYCGYSPSTFCKKIKGYVLPLVGPDHNRYAKSILDLWMMEPSQFKDQPIKRNRKPHMVQV
ncbi:hypothetical protein [Maridesulfovibrio zosterae]|uniref:hypothetical protein n=1 Tax=Maridesulfovibrio zosterae TaxID=82171 RepID=UPI00041B6D26|nr:hypothetical protein [Maridesulfovibrio zosterae]